jgi:F-type H+-transporting ATPase subunit delta
MSLIDRYVADLLTYAEENSQLENFYTYATIIMRGSESDSMPDELFSFLELLSPEDSEAVLVKFIEIAREHLGLLDVKVYSAVQLTVAQRAKIEKKIVDIFGKEISMILRVDPSLIGGLRVIVGNAVFDNTIKTRLADMKKNVYKEVYLKQ